MPMQTYVDSQGRELKAGQIKSIECSPGAPDHLTILLESGKTYVVPRRAFKHTIDFSFHNHMLMLAGIEYDVVRVEEFDGLYTLKSAAAKVQALPTAEPEVSDALVAMLELALTRAKSGEYTGVAYVATDRQGNTYSDFIINQPVIILGEMRVLERDITDECIKLRADDT